jgi:hypothetical protein
MPVQILRLMPGEPVENSQKSLPCLTQVGQPLLQLEILQVVGANSERKEYTVVSAKPGNWISLRIAQRDIPPPYFSVGFPR